MCGLTVFFQFSDFSADVAQSIALKMAERIAHRGSDDAGVWVDETAGIALAHRRLSIVDLSPAGHQPMLSVGGRYVMVFNGEIYNHLEMRRELEGFTLSPNPSPASGRGEIFWRGHSDTETLLAGFEAWGIEVTLKKTVVHLEGKRNNQTFLWNVLMFQVWLEEQSRKYPIFKRSF